MLALPDMSMRWCLFQRMSYFSLITTKDPIMPFKSLIRSLRTIQRQALLQTGVQATREQVNYSFRNGYYPIMRRGLLHLWLHGSRESPGRKLETIKRYTMTVTTLPLI